MAVKQITQVTIPGFGQYALYSFAYVPGFADGYGSIDAEFLSEDGEYDTAGLDSDLENHNFFTISMETGSLGQFTIASYEIASTGEYKILKVKFVDRSVELDRYLVALRGQVGYDNVAWDEMSVFEQSRIVGTLPTSGSRLIWVGKSDTSCREDILNELGQDPCDPCEASVNEDIVNKVNCDVYYTQNRRRYQYTFSELISALDGSGMGLTFSVSGSFEDHKFEHVGSVREVLSNICSELGLTFYYNPSGSRIMIVDVRAGIDINVKSINSEPNKCKILSSSIKKSKEGSKEVFGAAAFQRDPEEKRYGCAMDSCRKLRLKPFTIEDLFGEGEGAHFSQDPMFSSVPNAEMIRTFEACCVLTGRVSREFRDMFLWYSNKGYNFKTALDVQNNAIDKKLTALNGMTIKKVFSRGSEGWAERSFYRMLIRIMSGKDYEEIKQKNADKVYYFLAEIDSIKDEKVHNVENSICNNFFGKYWIRRFKQHWTGLSYSELAPDGTVTYYDHRSPINLPFADIVLEALGSLKNSPLVSRDGIIDVDNSTKAASASDTFYLMDRAASFSPAEISNSLRTEIDDKVNKYAFKEVTVPNESVARLKTFLANYDPAKHKVYECRELGSGEVLFTNQVEDHPEDKKNVVIRVNACNKYTSYGLDDANTMLFKFKFQTILFDIMLPVQSHTIQEGDQPHDGYTILVERQGNDATTTIPKLEIFTSGTTPSPSSSTFGIEFNNYNATSNDLELLSKFAGLKFCDLDTAKVQELLAPLAGLLNYSIGRTEERSYKVEGIPVDFYTIADGLKSISMSIGGSGLTTDISFSNSFPFRMTPDKLLQKLRYIHLQQIQKKTVQGKLPANDGDLIHIGNP